MAKRIFLVNDAGAPPMEAGRILMRCTTAVARDAVRRETIDGVEHVIISSMTLPDDVVMNGGLYPGEEIDKSFETLERTLAPVEHPTDADGNFISATDPTAIHNFYAGAFNQNVRKENGRIAIDKVINVAEALKSERGKRLLDRVAEIETNAEARPIHTSVGVFLEVEPLKEPKTNAAGDAYTWVARNMFFDHDAILLDSVGAAQPHQGVGMAVNSDGEKIKAHEALVTIDADDLGEMSHQEIRDALNTAITRPPINGEWVSDVFDSTVIFWAADLLFSASYVMDGRTATITSLPLPVERDVSYIPKTNNSEGDAMRQLMLNALAAAGITVNADISDDDLLSKYNEFLASQSDDNGGEPSDQGGELADVVANALKPISDRLEGLETKLNATDTAERDRLAEIVGNSDKYPGFTVDTAKKLDVNELKDLAANCYDAHGLPVHVNSDSTGGAKLHSYEMPK